MIYLQRQYANIINLTTERSTFANKILELALNRTGKSVDKISAAARNQFEIPKDTIISTTQSPAVMVQKISEMQNNINMMNGIIFENEEESPVKKLDPQDIERTKQMLEKDISTYNNDIKLLSLLLGRPISAQDIPKITSTAPNNLGNSVIRGTPAVTTRRITPTTKASTIPTFRPMPTPTMPAFKPLSSREEELLLALNNIQSPTTTTTTTTTTQRPVLAKSQEAVLAALLKQQGIGPNNNQLPIDVSPLENHHELYFILF